MPIVVAAVLLLIAGLAPSAQAQESPERVVIAPTLQVSPELAEARPGVPVRLTANLSHALITEMPVSFEVRTVGLRTHYPARPLPVEVAQCIVPVRMLTCSVTLTSQRPRVVVARAWLDDEGAMAADRDEGRLSSLALYPDPDADCRLEDGEPFDDKCRGGLNSQVQPGAAEPDGTDVVLVGWTGVAAAFVDCDDDSPDGDTEFEVRSPQDRTVSYLCTVHNRQTGEPVIGANIGGEILGGPFDPEVGGETHADFGRYDDQRRRSCSTTAPAGQCRFDLRIEGSGPGQVVLCLWSDGDNDGYFGADEIDGGDCAAEPVDDVEGTDGTDVMQVDLRDQPERGHSAP